MQRVNPVPESITDDFLGDFGNDGKLKKHVPQYRKVMWTKAEDDKLRSIVAKYGTDNWNKVAKSMQGRNAKQCRERWSGILSPELNKEAWTPQEDALLIQLHNQFGNKWALISTYLPGRSRIGLRNRWNLHMRHQRRHSLNSSIEGLNSFDANIPMAIGVNGQANPDIIANDENQSSDSSEDEERYDEWDKEKSERAIDALMNAFTQSQWNELDAFLSGCDSNSFVVGSGISW